MIAPANPSWQKRRAIFNHDWLKNQALPAFGAAGNVLRGVVESSMSIEEIIRPFTSVWPAKRTELHDLLEAFEAGTTPARMVGRLRLGQDASLVGELVHELWRARYRVSHLLAQAKSAGDEVDAAYKVWIERKDAAAVGVLGAACGKLARKLEVFPPGRMVV